jgi:hypothetical protein
VRPVRFECSNVIESVFPTLSRQEAFYVYLYFEVACLFLFPVIEHPDRKISEAILNAYRWLRLLPPLFSKINSVLDTHYATHLHMLLLLNIVTPAI